MAVMLTQWSPVPWSGETVPRPSLPSPSEAAAPTPIYETLVREWTRAGRTVPGPARHGQDRDREHEFGSGPGYGSGYGAGSGYGEAVDGGGLGWWRTDEPARHAYGAPAPTSPYGSGYGTEPEQRADAAAPESGGQDPDPPKPPMWERVAIL